MNDIRTIYCSKRIPPKPKAVTVVLVFCETRGKKISTRQARRSFRPDADQCQCCMLCRCRQSAQCEDVSICRMEGSSNCQAKRREGGEEERKIPRRPPGSVMAY